MGLPASKAARAERSDDCLHCVLMMALEGWFERYPTHNEQGCISIDAVEAISKLAECVSDVIENIPDRSGRRRAARFAHEAFDAAIQSARKGELISIEIPAEH